MWFDNNRLKRDQLYFKEGYLDVAANSFSTVKNAIITIALTIEEYRLDTRKYSFSRMKINEIINPSSVSMLKKK